MSNQVAARLKGDAYQLVYFWLQAAHLFYDKIFDTVSLERDDIEGVDDVGVTYREPGLHEEGRKIREDFFQLKYHVDHAQAYSWDFLIQRKTERSSSLLQKFYRAYLSRKDLGQEFRLTLVSNWQWRDDDKLAKSIRTDPSTLPKEFFDTSPERVYRDARTLWAGHLKISDDELLEFARHLRFKLNYFSQADLNILVNASLKQAGLEPMDFSRESNPYIALAESYIKDGRKFFKVEDLRQSCSIEGLLAALPVTNEPVRLGIRSRMRGAENMKSETSRMLCLCEHFDDRFIREPELWASEIYPGLVKFLQPAAFRDKEHHLILDCHLSVAYACGYLLEPTLGAQVYPSQKGTPSAVWKPDSELATDAFPSWGPKWLDLDENGSDLGVAVNLTHDILSEVEDHIAAKGLPIKTLLTVKLAGKPDWKSVKGPHHAIQLAGELQQLIRDTKRQHKTQTTHLFVCGPGGFMFFLGQAGKFFNPIQLYEHDPERIRGGGYFPSIRLPIAAEQKMNVQSSKEHA